MRKSVIALMTAAVAAGSMAVGIGPAEASKGDCAASFMCLWHDANYSSTLKQYHNSYNDLRSDSDEFDSVYNRTQVAWLLYDDKNFEGNVICVFAGHSAADLGNYGFHDRISSIKRRSDNTCAGYGTKI